jgi:hypothetical protein
VVTLIPILPLYMNYIHTYVPAYVSIWICLCTYISGFLWKHCHRQNWLFDAIIKGMFFIC